MKNKYYYRLLSIAFIFGLLVGETYCVFSAINDLTNQSFLEAQIKEEPSLGGKTYSFRKWNSQQIESITRGTTDPIEKKAKIESLEKEKETVTYFYLDKKRIEYFISVKLDENPEKSYCRLVVRTNGFVIETLNKMNLFNKENYQEHKINRSICNSLYGYGKPVM